MRKWIKTLMLLIALLLVSILALVYGGFRMFKAAPEWYRTSTISLAQREVLARRAFNKFTNIQNAAALARQGEIAQQSDQSAPTAASIVVSFSDDELNAFFEKWANYADWKSKYDRYVEDPIIINQENHICLAGRVKDLDAVVSVQFDPQIDEAGRLDLHLSHVLAGQLPLPDMLLSPYQSRLTATLKNNLPRWRALAEIDSSGAANSELISASMARLFIHAINHTAADPVLFLPLVERHANVPVRVSAVKVEDHDLTMTVFPLNAKERSALLDRIRAEE